MSRLPVPGGDDGTWGDILNNFLDVAHNADGSLKPIAESGVTNLTSELAAAEKTTNKAQPSGYASLDSGGQVPLGQLGNVPSAPNATTSSKGIVQLDGDLSGTASSPIVQGLQGNFVAPTSPSNGQVLKWNQGSTEWQPTTLAEGDIASLTSDLSAKAPLASPTFTGHVTVPNGTSSTDAAAYGQIPSALPPSGSAGGDLTGTYPNPTLSGTTNVESIISANTTVSGALQKSNNLSDVASASSSRTNLGLGTAATHATGDFLQSANNLSDLTSASSARGNLGLGTAATENVGTSAGTVMAGNQAAGGDLTGTLPSPALVTTGVTAGSYTSTNLTVDAKGRITAASSGASAQQKTIFSVPGAIAVQTYALRFYFTAASTLLGVVAAVNTAPTGQSMIVDVLHNGTTLWGTNGGNKPTINASANLSSSAGGGSNGESVPDTTAMSAGDYLQISPTQIGSGVGGSDLTVTVRYSTP